MRKGFLHVVEALIVIMLVFVVLSQFYTIPRSDHSWSETKLRIMAQDLLYSLDEGDNVDWLDAASVNTEIVDKQLLPGSMGYSLKTRPLVRPEIMIGCVCDVVEFAYIRDNITSFSLNGIGRTFTVERASPLDFNLDDPGGGSYLGKYDVIIFFGVPTINIQQAVNLSAYLRLGNGVVEYADLTEAQVNEDWHRDTFNLEWATTAVDLSGNGWEFQFLETYEQAHDIKRLYDLFNDPASGFTVISDDKVYPLSRMENRILVRHDDYYQGGIYEGKSAPLVVVNWGVNGNGRSAWMANGNFDTLDDDRNMDLLESVILWTAGGKDYIIKDETFTENAKASFRKVLNTEIYEPVWVELTLGYHF